MNERRLLGRQLCQSSLQYPNLGGRSRAALTKAASSNSTNTGGRSNPHSRHPCTWPLRGTFNVHQFTAPTPAPSRTRFLPSTANAPPTNCTAGSGLLSCVAALSKGHVWRSKSGILFTTTTSELRPRAVLRPAWTRNTRTWAESHRSTRHPSSKKVPQPQTSLDGPRG
jgi:hypothetical protein